MTAQDVQIKKVPRLRFKTFDNEWSLVKLSNIANFKNGKAHESVIDPEGKFVVVNSKFISSEGAIAKYSNSNICPLDKNDVVIVMSDIPNGRALAKCFFIDEDNKYTLNQRIGALTANGSVSKYLFYAVNRHDYYLKFNNGVSQTNLRRDEVLSLPLIMPDTEEQEKIADFITSIDDKIAVLEQTVNLMTTYKKGAMQSLFGQYIRFKDKQEKAYPSWQEKKLGVLEDEELVKLGRGEVISKIDIANYPGDYPIYSSSVKNDGLFGRYGKYMFDEELISWSIDGGGHFFYRPKQKFSVTNVSGWLRINSATLDCRFLALQLQYLHERQVFDYQSKAHPSVIRDIYHLKLPVIEEQQKIATFITAFEDKIRLKESKLEQAKNFKKALLQQMFVYPRKD